jgi:chromosome partitioning protein
LDFFGADINLAPVAERDFQTIFGLKESLGTLNGKYQYCVIDTLPSFGHLHLAALVAADYVLIPVKPAPYALLGMKDLFGTVQKVKTHMNPDLKVLGIIINQADGRKPILEREMEEALRESFGDLVMKSKINKRVRIEESPAFQKPITQHDPKGPAATEFKAMTAEALRRIRNGN